MAALPMLSESLSPNLPRLRSFFDSFRWLRCISRMVVGYFRFSSCAFHCWISPSIGIDCVFRAVCDIFGVIAYRCNPFRLRTLMLIFSHRSVLIRLRHLQLRALAFGVAAVGSPAFSFVDSKKVLRIRFHLLPQCLYCCAFDLWLRMSFRFDSYC
jgi:hypothetical protein